MRELTSCVTGPRLLAAKFGQSREIAQIVSQSATFSIEYKIIGTS